MVSQGICADYTAFKKKVFHIFHLDHMSYEMYCLVVLGDVYKLLIL